MSDTFPLNEGDTLVVAQLSPCLGGLIRTWTSEDGSQLWSLPDPTWLAEHQGTGTIARTLREDRRYREVAMLSRETGALLVQPRFPDKVESDTLQMQAQVLQLAPPAEPADTAAHDLSALLTRATRHCFSSGEFLVVEHGGWDAPQTPFCLFAVLDDNGSPLITIETSPPPNGSEAWDPHIHPGNETAGLRAPATPETLEVAPFLMIEAIARWGVAPWDLALTFGTP